MKKIVILSYICAAALHADEPLLITNETEIQKANDEQIKYESQIKSQLKQKGIDINMREGNQSIIIDNLTLAANPLNPRFKNLEIRNSSMQYIEPLIGNFVFYKDHNDLYRPIYIKNDSGGLLKLTIARLILAM